MTMDDQAMPPDPQAVAAETGAFALTPYADPAPELPQPDLFGPVTEALTLQDVQRAIRGVSRPRDLRPLIQKSTHDPLANMLELAMKAKDAGQDTLAFERFAEVLPYVWTKVNGNGPPGLPEGAAFGAGEVVYRWATGGEADR